MTTERLVTVKPGGSPGSDCDYTSVTAALAAYAGLPSRDLVAQDVRLVIECITGSAPDASNITGTGWTCDQARNITIRPRPGSEQIGRWDAARYRVRVTSGWCVQLTAPYMVVEDLQLEQAGTASYVGGIDYGGAMTTYARRCQVRKTSSGVNQRGVSCALAGAVGVLEHCVVFDWLGTGSLGFIVGQNAATLHVRNCTVHNCTRGMWRYTGYLYAYNVLITGCTSTHWESGINGGSHNASSDASAPATGTYYRNVTPAYADAPNGDFHWPGCDLAGFDITTLAPAGAALDIDRQPVTAWRVGADAVPGVPASGYSDGDAVIAAISLWQAPCLVGSAASAQVLLEAVLGDVVKAGVAMPATLAAETSAEDSALCGVLQVAQFNSESRVEHSLHVGVVTLAEMLGEGHLDGVALCGVRDLVDLAGASNWADRAHVGLRMDEVYTWIGGWSDAAPVTARTVVARFTGVVDPVARFAAPVDPVSRFAVPVRPGGQFNVRVQ